MKNKTAIMLAEFCDMNSTSDSAKSAGDFRRLKAAVIY